MNKFTLRHAFILFHLTLGIVILAESLRTIVLALAGSPDNPVGSALPFLAGAEALAALFFLIPQTMKTASRALIAILLFAFLAHGLTQFVLLVYATGVFFVYTHGSAYSKNLQHAGG